MRASATAKPSRIIRLLLWLNLLHSLLLGATYLSTHLSPNAFPYLPFLGLAYPALLLTAFLFMGIWVVVRWRYLLISLTTLLAGAQHIYHFYALTLIQPPIEQALKIISFNVHTFEHYNLTERTHRRDAILHFLEQQQADIICFQEFFHHRAADHSVTRERISETLDLPYYHERHFDGPQQSDYVGVATFSNSRIVNRGEVTFSNDRSNSCIYSDIVKDGDTVRVFNAHLGSIRLGWEDYAFFEKAPSSAQDYAATPQTGRRIVQRLKRAFEKRAVQAEQVAAAIDASPYPVIFCGDLNDTPTSYCYRQFSSRLNDAFVQSGNGIGQTYVGQLPSHRIDYIFYATHFTGAHFTTHQMQLSDHKPISVVLDVRSN